MMILALLAIPLIATPSAPPSAAAAATTSPIVAPAPMPASRNDAQAATIEESASTNTAARALVVWPDGGIAVKGPIVGGPPKHVDAKLAKALFVDLRSAGPLERLQSGQCMKSASFGTTLTVRWHGMRSPDLSCPGGAREERLAADLGAILAALRFDVPARSDRR